MKFTGTQRTTRAEYNKHVAGQMREAALQTQVIALAKTLGYLVYHTHDSRRSHKGWPDLVLAHPDRNRFLIRELKSQRGYPTPEQREWLAALTALGIDAGIWRPIDLFDGTIQKQLTQKATP